MANKPSFFEVTFLIKEVKYRYRFQITSEKIIEEGLYYAEARIRENYLFERIGQNIKVSKVWNKESNLYIDTAFNFSSKLATVWHSSDYNDKQLVQFLVFPEGIYYNRKNEECRTPKTNKTFSYFSEVARVSEGIEKGNYNNILQFPSLVERRRSDKIANQKIGVRSGFFFKAQKPR